MKWAGLAVLVFAGVTGCKDARHSKTAPEAPAPTKIEGKPAAPTPSDPSTAEVLPPTAQPPALLPQEWRKYVTEGRVSHAGQSIVDVSNLSEDDEDWDPCGVDQRISIGLSLKGEKKSHQVELSSEKACNSFINALADASPKRMVGAKDYRVEIAPGRMRNKCRPVYTVASVFCRGFDDAGCAGDYEQRYSALITLAGPVLAWSEVWGQRSGGGPPYYGDSWHTIDLRTGKTAELLDFVEEASLVAAIKKSKSIAEADPEDLGRLAKAKTWNEALAILTSGEEQREFQSFAFSGYDAKQRRVSVQLGFDEFQGFGSYTVASVEVSAAPTKLLLPYLEAGQNPVFLQTPGMSIGIGEPEADPTDH